MQLQRLGGCQPLPAPDREPPPTQEQEPPQPMEPTPEPPPRTLGQGLLQPLALPMMMMSTMECQPTLRNNMERQSTPLRQY